MSSLVQLITLLLQERYFDQLNNLITELGIQDQVTLDGSYMDEQKSLKLLRTNDLII